MLEAYQAILCRFQRLQSADSEPEDVQMTPSRFRQIELGPLNAERNGAEETGVL